ncbi:MAG: PDZ domain-containing protein [Nitrospirales bacterium]|nr:PDZ domain-containing protein [Nitrospirales bacterium]
MAHTWLAIILIGLANILLPPISALSYETSKPLSSVIEKAKSSTVGILKFLEDTATPENRQQFSIRGTGIHIGNGYIVTARHAVERPEGGKIIVPPMIHVLTGQFDELQARFIGVSEFLDIALYHLAGDTLPSSLTSNPFGVQEPNMGEEVFTVGYPLGWGPAIGFGRVGNQRTFLPTTKSRLLQVDLSACRGNSGGGLFNHQGEIVGMIQSIIQTEEHSGERRCSRLAFAVPGSFIQRIARALIENTHPGFPKLGIRMMPLKRGTTWKIAVAKATGPARQGGLRKGDILLSIEDHIITSSSQLKSYLIEHTIPGQSISITVLRGNQEQTFVVILGKS